MNRRASKYCRRLAEALTTGTKSIGYQLDKRKKTVYIKGEPTEVVKGVIQLSPGCTRWVYRMLKEKFNRGELKMTDAFTKDLEAASDAVIADPDSQ